MKTLLCRLFASYYERSSQSQKEKARTEPLRKKVAGQARGLVLEIGTGNGLNFEFYDPKLVTRVEATEPDATMLKYASGRSGTAPVQVHLTQAPVEQLPFPDASFDSVVCTLVFCSVDDPEKGIQEIKRVLKPGGLLLMLEHVRAETRLISLFQAMITPISRLLMGNCHWDRRTDELIGQSGFQKVTSEHYDFTGGLVPMMLFRITR